MLSTQFKENTPHREEAITFNRKILDFIILLTAMLVMLATGYLICKHSNAVAEQVEQFDAYKPVPGAFDGLTQREIEGLEQEKEGSQAIDRYVSEPSRGEIRTLTMEATAYCYTGCRTYTGTWPQEGRTVAVDPDVIPLGTQLVIDGRGGYVAEDVGGAIVGRKLDIYMADKQRAIEFGRRDVEVRILE